MRIPALVITLMVACGLATAQTSTATATSPGGTATATAAATTTTATTKKTTTTSKAKKSKKKKKHAKKPGTQQTVARSVSASGTVKDGKASAAVATQTSRSTAPSR